MTQRLDIAHVAPKAYRAMIELQSYVNSTHIEPQLRNLISLRASYMNGCAYCVDMHTKDARADGETEQRLYAVPIWRETPFFTPKERAVLAFVEAMTELGQEGVPDDVYDEARTHFDESGMVELMMAVVVINSWNRLMVTIRRDVGDYQPQVRKAS
ncbi:MAG TPA: carboxymuconolactone decarboxylase family protein [Gemmatimonadaceae bacterium]